MHEPPAISALASLGVADVEQLSQALAAIEPRLDGIETLLRTMVTILQRRNRISLRLGEHQVTQILKQVSAELGKLQAHHEA